MKQLYIKGFDNFLKLLKKQNTSNIFLVCGKSFLSSYLKKDLDDSGVKYSLFTDFSPNPKHSDVKKAIDLFLSSKTQTLVAVGGGSAIDVAKCVKLESGVKDVQLFAMPTTAGSGSESTRYIVVYDNKGNKESLGDSSTLPNYVVLEPNVLKTLPHYQRKSTLLDALCQAIESWWSVSSTAESIEYSKECIDYIINNMDEYITGDDAEIFDKIMLAANFSGRAIDITATTAAHAMSYKLTSIFNIPHGNAVAICLPVIWSKMLECKNQKLNRILDDIANFMGFKNSQLAIDFFKNLLDKWQMIYPKSDDRENHLNILTDSVNIQRLKNNPIVFDKNVIRDIYSEVLR